jgi:IMP-specific 5'-nucleotidase
MNIRVTVGCFDCHPSTVNSQQRVHSFTRACRTGQYSTCTLVINKKQRSLHFVLPQAMSFSSRRRNYLLTPHRRDGLIEWYDTRKSRALRTVSRLSASLLMLVFVVVAFIGVLRACRMKSMLQHSFVLDALETTGADTFSHFEMLIEEHRELTAQQQNANDLDSLFPTSRLKQLVPTIGVFHTPLPLRAAFEVYNDKHRLTKRKHIQVSFNECRHILNLAQIMALRKVQKPEAQKVLATTLKEDSVEQGSSNQPSKADNIPSIRRKFRMESIGSFNDLGEEDMPADLAGFNGPKLISFDGDQTLYSDGQNFERNPRLAFYLYLLLRHGVTIAVVTAAGYEYMVR